LDWEESSQAQEGRAIASKLVGELKDLEQ
jgi:hypothetical protein